MKGKRNCRKMQRFFIFLRESAGDASESIAYRDV
jgi:hypothetical protein